MATTGAVSTNAAPVPWPARPVTAVAPVDQRKPQVLVVVTGVGDVEHQRG